MNHQQARDLQREAERLRDGVRAGHVEAEDFIILAQMVVELLSHTAAREEARARVPKIAAVHRKKK